MTQKLHAGVERTGRRSVRVDNEAIINGWLRGAENKGLASRRYTRERGDLPGRDLVRIEFEILIRTESDDRALGCRSTWIDVEIAISTISSHRLGKRL